MVALNKRGRANLNAIMSGFVADQAEAWGGSTVTIRSLPSLDVRSAWAIGPAPGSMSERDAEKNWRELGDGPYLMTVEQKGVRMHAVVDVVDGVAVDREPIDEDQVGALPGLYALLDEASVVSDGLPAGPAPVVAVPVADRADVGVEHRH